MKKSLFGYVVRKLKKYEMASLPKLSTAIKFVAEKSKKQTNFEYLGKKLHNQNLFYSPKDILVKLL